MMGLNIVGINFTISIFYHSGCYFLVSLFAIKENNEKKTRKKVALVSNNYQRIQINRLVEIKVRHVANNNDIGQAWVQLSSNFVSTIFRILKLHTNYNRDTKLKCLLFRNMH